MVYFLIIQNKLALNQQYYVIAIIIHKRADLSIIGAAGFLAALIWVSNITANLVN
jgi:hypothetical protein